MKLVHLLVPSLALRLVATLVSTCLALAACGGGADAPPPPGGGVAPTITQQPADASVSAGQPASFSVVASGDAPLAYQWQRGSADIAGATGATYTLAVAAATDDGAVFRVVVGNAAGSVTSNAATLTVTASATAPTISSFTATPATLPIGGGSVTLNWASSGATTLSIDNGVGDVTGLTSKAVNVAANTTFTLTATNAVGSVNATTTVTLAAAADRFVDPVNGNDANPCTAAAPCQSIGQALTNAPAGSTLALADGVYTPPPNSGFEVGVPDGVTLRATHAGAATIAEMGLFLHGSATIDGLVVDRTGPTQNTCGAITAQGSNTVDTTLTLVGVFSNCPDWLGLGPNVKATLTPGSLPGGLYTTGLPAGNQLFANVAGTGAELLIQGGTLDGGNVIPPLAVGKVLNVFAGGKLTLDGVTMRNYLVQALDVSGQAILRNGTTIDHVGIAGDPGPLSGGLNQCTTTSAILVDRGGSLTMDQATLSNVASAGICMQPAFTAASMESVQVTQSTFAHIAGAAIESYDDTGIGQLPPAAFGPTIAIDSTTFTDTGRAIFWYAMPGASLTLTNVTVTASTAAANTGGSTENCQGAAIRFDTGTDVGSFKMRNSTVSNNAAEGLCFVGASPAVDLGTPGDPGGNTVTGNTTTGLADYVIATGTPTTANAVGNVWTANQQGADGNGRYSVPPGFTAVPKTGPASGVNFIINNALGTVNF